MHPVAAAKKSQRSEIAPDSDEELRSAASDNSSDLTQRSWIQNVGASSTSNIYAVQGGDQHIHHYYSDKSSDAPKRESATRVPKGPSRILLPLGAEDLFYPFSDPDDSGKMDFGFDPHGMSFVVHELISHGAVAVATHAGSGLADNCDHLPSPFAGRIKVVDRDQRVLAETNALTRPLARSLGFEPDELGIIDQPIAAPMAYLLQLPAERR